MKCKNARNERIKRDYFHYLRNADRKSEQTVRQSAKAISRYEDFSERQHFKTFNQKMAVAFKTDLAKTGLAPATVHSTLKNMQRFLGWLALQPGFKRTIRQTEIGFLSLPDKEARVATSAVEKPFPTLPMVENVVAAMQSDSAIEKRDRALIAFTAISGIRDGALVSLKLKHFDEGRRLIMQNPMRSAPKPASALIPFCFHSMIHLSKYF